MTTPNDHSSIPEATPSASYSLGWKTLTSRFWLLTGVTITSMIANGGLRNLSDTSEDGLVWLASLLFGLLVSNPVQIGLSWVFAKVTRGDGVKFSDVFEGFRRNYSSTVFTPVLLTIVTTIGFILFIIPGIILAIRLAFTNYLVLDQNLSPVDAMKASWTMTKGSFWTLLGMCLIAIPIGIGGIILLGVGIIPAVTWIGCSFAALYNAVLLKQASQ